MSGTTTTGPDSPPMALDDLERRIAAELASRQADLERDLAEHVGIATGFGHPPGLDAYRATLVARLEALGATVRMIDGDDRPAWLELPGAPPSTGAPPPTTVCERAGPGPRILFAGHLDTVHDPHGDFDRLEPTTGTLANGPGAADMKGGTLVAIAALEALHACGVPCAWTFVLNCDEETGTFHSARHLAEIAASHDIGLVMEPALPDGSLAIERMGSGQFKIECFGRSAHVGREFAKGISAVEVLARVITELISLVDLDAGRIVNIGPLRGGDVTNAVPDHAEAWGNVRFRDPAAQAELEAGFARVEAAWATDESGRPRGEGESPRVVLHRAFNRPAKPCTDGVRALAEAARRAAEALGQELPFASTGGVCDGNILQAAGLPVIDTLGVRGGNLHRRDEFADLASLSERASLMAVLVKRLASGADGPLVD